MGEGRQKSVDFSLGRTNFQGSLLRRGAPSLETPSPRGALIINIMIINNNNNIEIIRIDP